MKKKAACDAYRDRLLILYFYIPICARASMKTMRAGG
jgi:hypothetical protein